MDKNLKGVKIAIVASRFPPQGEIGGIEIASQDIARFFAKEGSRVYVATCGQKSLVENLEKNLIVYRVLSPKIKFVGNLFFWFKIFFVLLKIKPDIIHCQTIQMGLPCYFLKKIYKKPYIVWCHGFDVYFPWKFKKIISTIVLNSASAVVAVTEHMRAELQKVHNKEIFVIPNSVDLNKFKGLSKSDLRNKYSIARQEKIIIFVGVIRQIKGVKYLIDAFSIISKEAPEAKLFLVGDGPEKNNLQNIIKGKVFENKVFFTGKMDDKKVAEYMTLSDIFVLPSLSEGFPLVILEAMAAGLPVVCTNVRGLPEIIKDGKNGFLVKSKSAEQISEKVLFFLGNDKLRGKVYGNNIKKAKYYSLENICKKIENIYLKTLSHG